MPIINRTFIIKYAFFTLYSKRPPPISSKKQFQPPMIEISECCLSIFCIFFNLGGAPPSPPPGKSSSRVFCQYSLHCLFKKINIIKSCEFFSSPLNCLCFCFKRSVCSCSFPLFSYLRGLFCLHCHSIFTNK